MPKALMALKIRVKVKVFSRVNLWLIKIEKNVMWLLARE
jgi:hypothetical protein